MSTNAQSAWTASIRAPSPAVSLGRVLCIPILLFASSDLWPTLTVGFTFRFCQLCEMLALLLLVAGAPDLTLRRFPGALWLFAFVAWMFVTLPFSLFAERSAGYSVWALLDVLMVVTFVQYFPTPATFQVLFRWFLLSFVATALFGLLQFALAFAGIDLFVTQWIVYGRVARINGLCYEPSYFSTYLLPGWVLSLYLMEKRVAANRGLVRVCAWTTTVALILCTSRLGWLMMLLWGLLRLGAFAGRTLLAGRLSLSSARSVRIAAVALAALGASTVMFNGTLASHIDDVSFLVKGLGLLGQAAHSVDDRSSDFQSTWVAFLAHPVVGTGVGAVSVVVAREAGSAILSLEDTKKHEGLSLVGEILASTGIVGGALVALFAAVVSRELRLVSARLEEDQRYILHGLAWSFVWLLIAMEFSPTFLRVYIFVDLAVLISCVVAFKPTVGRSPAAATQSRLSS